MTPSPNAQTALPKIHILMATHNGETHLAEQLESLAAQDYPNWKLWVRDDASQDQTVPILQAFRDNGHDVHIVQGKQLGAAQNFLTLIRKLPDADMSWVAFSDQDDIWLKDRLNRGYSALQNISKNSPALYSSRTFVQEEGATSHHISAERPRAPSFQNALVQNIAAGNTILLNPAATTLMQKAAQGNAPVVMHDWAAYLLVMGAGGYMVHDDKPTVIYRQHSENQMGANLKIRAQAGRFLLLWQGKFREWNATNITFLQSNSALLDPSSREILEGFSRLHKPGLCRRLLVVWRLGLYRQTLAGSLALWFAAVFNRL